jgi:hypothetical protein
MRRALLIAGGLGAMLVAAPRLRAQQAPFGVGAGVSASTVHVTRDGFVASELKGPLLGGAGRVRFGRMQLDVAYAEGELTPLVGTGGTETLADASLVLSAAVGAGFSIGGGAHARAFIGTASTVRWMRTELHARYERELIPGLATADVALWQVLGADVNAQGGADGGRGAVAGLTIQLPNSPFALRAAYTADRMAYANGTSEFLDHVEVGLRFRRD